jgi:hypothetical protein
MSREPTLFHAKVMPDPEVAKLLEERIARVRPPPDALLHRDRVQAKLRKTEAAESLPAFVSRQAS